MNYPKILDQLLVHKSKLYFSYSVWSNSEKKNSIARNTRGNRIHNIAVPCETFVFQYAVYEQSYLCFGLLRI